ncbi:MAG: DUF438 domain-containing protein [Thermodesulfobacteriota bacterium]
MEVNGETKVLALLEPYPFLIETLVSISPHFNNLKDPVLRETMGKVATLNHASAVSGVPVDELFGKLAAAVLARTGEPLTWAETRPAAPGSPSDPEARRESLKSILRELHAGEDPAALKEKFKQVIQGVDAAELAGIEQQLINEGLPVEEVKRLCDVHVQIFKEALEEQDRPEAPAGHPVHTFMKENRALEDVLSDLHLFLGGLGRPLARETLAAHLEALKARLDRLAAIEIHYTRKENQLFPLLEAHHFTGPSQVMWSIHDEIRASLRRARRSLDELNPQEMLADLSEAAKAMREMIYKEEFILFPTSLKMLSQAEWLEVKAGEAEIGFAWIEPDEGWPDRAPAQAAPAAAEPRPQPVQAGVMLLDTGRLTPEQINLVLTHLPVDVTFVDENDRVAYYSQGKERIFPRSPAIIGREVRHCHPPKSLHKVNRILDEFKAGTKDSAEFWIELKGRFLHIRYFAVRDEKKRYRGTLEVSQDLTELRKLTGQKRLLDWD